MIHHPREFVYVIDWPERGFAKAGITWNQRRYKSFLSRRGGVLHALFDFPVAEWRVAAALETALHDEMASVARRAFACKEDATPFLGGRGGGYLECYELTTDQLIEAVPRAMLRAMPGFRPGAKHERTNVTDELTDVVVTFHRDISPVRYARENSEIQR